MKRNIKITFVVFVLIAMIGGMTEMTLTIKSIQDQSAYADLPDQKIEGFKYQVKISDGIATKDILR